METLSEAREQKGLNRTELAAYVGVTEQTVRRWEDMRDLGKLPYKKLEKLAEVLDKPLNFFTE